jgi:hypothetical protein
MNKIQINIAVLIVAIAKNFTLKAIIVCRLTIFSTNWTAL